MSETTCCYKLKCKRIPKYWVRKKEAYNFWYPLCLKHFKKIIKNSKIEIIALKTERARKFEHKIFCAQYLNQDKFKNWKGSIDWEEIASELDIDKPITFEVYRALQKHYYNNYLKIKKRINKKRVTENESIFS